MIIAVIAVRMVKMAVDQVIDVVTMGHRLVPAVGAVNVTPFVAGTGMLGRALGGIGAGDVQHVLLDLPVSTDMMHVTVVEVVHVVAVLDSRVLTVGSVVVIMVSVCFRHVDLLIWGSILRSHA